MAVLYLMVRQEEYSPSACSEPFHSLELSFFFCSKISIILTFIHLSMKNLFQVHLSVSISIKLLQSYKNKTLKL